MTKRTTNFVSGIFLSINNHTSTRTVLSFSGVIHILILAFLWIGLLWLGFFLILFSSDISVIHSISKESASLVNKIYFSGYILSTLGNGEFIPTSRSWQVTVALFSFSGFFFITTTISYLVNLNSVILHKRTLSLLISNLGESAEDIVINTYSKGNFSYLLRLIPRLQEEINELNQNHLAYPVSHYFTSISTQNSLPINLFNLDEALTIIKYQVDKEQSLENDIRPLRDAIKKFLTTIRNNFVTEIQDERKLSPNKQKFQDLGIPLADQSDIHKNTESIKERRYLFYGFFKSNGWNLKDIDLGHVKKSD